MDAAIAALAGAAIGAVATFGGNWLTQRHQSRRELLRSAVELGQAERQERREKLAASGGGPILPVSVYVAHHAEVLQAIAGGNYGPDVVRKIEDAQKELISALAVRYDRGKEG